MLPLIQRMVVEEKKWLDQEEMVDCISISQSLPGVVAINTATYVGNRKAGLKGAIAASLGVILPSYIVIILAVTLLDVIGVNEYIAGAFTGVKAAASGLILYSAIKLAKKSLKNLYSWVLFLVTFILVAVFDVSVIAVIVSGILLGILYIYLKRKEDKA